MITDQAGGVPPPSSKSPMRMRLKRGGDKGGAGGGGGGGAGGGLTGRGFTMWALHENTEKPLSVVPTTAMTLLDTYIVTVAKRFPDDAGVQVRGGREGGDAVTVVHCFLRTFARIMLILIESFYKGF